MKEYLAYTWKTDAISNIRTLLAVVRHNVIRDANGPKLCRSLIHDDNDIARIRIHVVITVAPPIHRTYRSATVVNSLINLGNCFCTPVIMNSVLNSA